MHYKRYFLALLVLTILGSFDPASGQGQNSPHPVVSEATRSDTSPPLRQIPERPPMPVVLGEIFERPRKMLPNRLDSPKLGGPDSALQAPIGGAGAPAVGGSFEGVNNVNGVLPPDPTGDIGPNHYVQAVNLAFAIYSRAGTRLYGPANINTLWTGFGGPCQNTNDGDPIVQYDHLADRWMISQFALPNFPSGPFYQCIAVSQTGDPTGSWFRYQFTISLSKLNDYPKFGVWPDGYYMSMNQYTCNIIRCSWAGGGVVAFERSAMLAGAPTPKMVSFDLYSVDANLGGMLPSDLDGPAPAAGTPNLFSEVDDNAWGYSPDQLQLWAFHADWTNPGSSSFTHVANLPTAAFDSNMCNYSRNCIPQPGTSAKVDAISDRLMYRLQYRNFGTYQALLANHTVDVNATNRGGIRWYELRNSGGGWSIYQQGTYSPDGNHRWMASLAQNKLGDIGLGFSISSGSVFPSILATGRLAGDPAGQMTQGESTIVNGSGSQTHSSGRWGDYSQLGVDPVDDCTFWYTQEYYSSTGSAPWKTRIGSFKLRDCVVGDVHDVAVTLVDAPASVTVGTSANVAVTVANQGNQPETVTVTATDTPPSGGTAGLLDCGPAFALATGNTVLVNCTWNTTGITTGAHIINATASIATDANPLNNSGSDTSTVTSPGGGSTMHVGDLDGSGTSQGNGNNWTAAVTLTVHDSGHNPVSSATVSGAWSAGTTGAASCITNAAGQCSVSKGGLKKNTVSSVTFTVNGVSHATLTYASGSNHDPDGDSNGTAIVVFKP